MIKLKITALTPVSVGSGSEFSPYAEYIIKEGRAYIIDKQKLQEKIAGNDKWLDEYVEGVAKGMDNNQSTFDLNVFLENTLEVSVEEYSIISYPVESDNITQKLPVKAMLKTPFFEPYIPGSSLKGALKTVIMYHWLNRINNDTHDPVLLQWVDDFFNNCYKAKYECSRGMEDLLNQWENIYNQKNSGLVKIEGVRDSIPFTKDSGIVVDCNRDVPIRLECINKGAESEVEIWIEKEWKKLAKQINDYSYTMFCQSALVYENNKRKENPDYPDMWFKEDLKRDKDNPESTVAYMRLGFGKGFYFNSIVCAFYDYIMETDESKKKALNKFLKMAYSKFDTIETFPSTFLKSTKTNETLGWIKLELIS